MAKIAVFLLGFVPPDMHGFISGIAGRFLCLLTPSKEKVIRANLDITMSTLDSADKKRIVLKSYQNLVRYFLELSFLARRGWKGVKDLIEIKGQENLLNSVKEDRGVVVFSAHLGNWELIPVAISQLNVKTAAVARPLDNPYLDEFITRHRMLGLDEVIVKRRALIKALKFLKKGYVVGFLVDQNVQRHEGVFVDFFGVPACTTAGLACLALKSGAPVFPIFMHSVDGKGYIVEIGKEVEIVRTGNEKEDVVTNTQIFTKMVEEEIRKRPEDWFWFHKRWKTRPKGDKRKIY